MGNGLTEMICTFQNRNAIIRRYKLKAINKTESLDSLGELQLEDFKLFFLSKVIFKVKYLDYFSFIRSFIASIP